MAETFNRLVLSTRMRGFKTSFYIPTSLSGLVKLHFFKEKWQLRIPPVLRLVTLNFYGHLPVILMNK